METYDAMRRFADGWGLLAMFVAFVGIVLFVWLRPGARRKAQDAKNIPFRDYGREDDPAPGDGSSRDDGAGDRDEGDGAGRRDGER